MVDVPKLFYIGAICIVLVVVMGALLPVVFGIWYDMDTTGMTWGGAPDMMGQLPITLMPFFGVIIIGAVVVVAFKSAF